MILLTTLTALAVVVILSRRVAPTYTATARLRVLTTPEGALGTAGYDEVFYADRLLNTYVELATSRPVLEEVMHRLGLDGLPVIQVNLLAATELIEIAVTDENAVLASEVTNTLAEILVAQSLEVYTGSGPTATEIISEQLAQIQDELDQARSQYETLIADSPEDANAIEAVMRTISLKEEIYFSLLGRYEQVRTLEAARANSVSIVEPATTPAAPSGPNVMLTLVVGLLAGVMGGTGLAFFLEHVDTRLHTPGDIEVVTGLPILGEIPTLRTGQQAVALTIAAPEAEAFRQLRTNLFSLSQDSPLHTLLFTSAEPREGKSLVVAHLAAIIAQAGREVVIIDGDMRRPALHQIYHLPNEGGLSSVLMNGDDVADVLQEVEGLPGLHVLTGGPRPSHPAELLGSPPMAALLDQLAGQFDLVMLDAPAYLAVTDAAVLASGVDGVVLVVGRAQTRREVVQTTCAQLLRVQANVVGVVINRSDAARRYRDYYAAASNGAGHAVEPTEAIFERLPAQRSRASPLKFLLGGLPSPGILTPRRASAWLKERLVQAIERLRHVELRAVRWWDVGAAGALLVWLLLLFYVQRVHHSFMGVDQIFHYFPAAQGVLEGEGIRAFAFDVYRGPGYPVMLVVGTSLLGGDMFEASKVISVLSSALFLLFSYLLVRRIFDSPTAFLSMVLIAGVNTYVWASTSAGTDLPFGWLTLASLFFLIRSQVPGRLELLLAGLLGGLAFTIRWTGLILPLLMVAWLVLIPRQTLGLRARLERAALYGLAFLVGCGPWLYANTLLHGSPLYNEAGIAIDTHILPYSTSLTDSLFSALRDRPLDFIGQLVGKFFTSFPAAIQGLSTFPHPDGWVMADSFWLLILVGGGFVLARLDRRRAWLWLITVLWWGALALIHYESRFLLPLLPTFAASAVYIFTSGALPDARLRWREGQWVTVTAGNLLRRLAGARLPDRLRANAAGVSLVSVALAALLLPTALKALQNNLGDHYWMNDTYGFYHEIAQVVRETDTGATPLPVAVRQWSPARYWFPSEGKRPTLPYPPEQDYEAVLPDVAYVLYDQWDNEDVLVEYWDPPSLAELTEPLNVPANLELSYYRVSPRLALLYRVLDENTLAQIMAASASSTLPESPATALFDGDPQSGWESEPRADEHDPVSLVFELARPTPINRIWLLPAPEGRAFPAALAVEVSRNGQTWQTVIEAEDLPTPVQQSPRVFSFAETTARWVRVTVTALRPDENAGAYRAALAEVRLSLAVERPAAWPEFVIEPDDVFLDSLSNELVARVHSASAASGPARVAFYAGWSVEDTARLATVETAPIAPHRSGEARLPLDEQQAPEPGSCEAIWVVYGPLFDADADLDRYQIEARRPRTAQTFAGSVCSSERVVIDDFDYVDSPLARGWTTLPDETSVGQVSTLYVAELDSRVMHISTGAQEGYLVMREMAVYHRPDFTVSARSTSDYIVYVTVRDSDGALYYVQYMPFTWPEYTDEFPEGPFISYPLGTVFADGNWHTIQRNVYADFLARTGREAVSMEAVAFRAFGDLDIASPALAAPR